MSMMSSSVMTDNSERLRDNLDQIRKQRLAKALKQKDGENQ